MTRFSQISKYLKSGRRNGKLNSKKTWNHPLKVWQETTNTQPYLQTMRRYRENCEESRYLGVILSKDLGCNKANAVFNMLRRQLRGTTEKTTLTLYKSLIRPILEYASAVWSPYLVSQQHQLEQAQRWIVRWILILKRDDSVSLNQISIGLKKIVDRMQWKDLRLLEDVRSEKIDIAHLPSAKVGSKINSIIIIAAGQIIIHAIQMQ